MVTIMVSVPDRSSDDPAFRPREADLQRLDDALKANAAAPGPISVAGVEGPGLDLLAMATSMAPSLLTEIRSLRRAIREACDELDHAPVERISTVTAGVSAGLRERAKG